MTIATCVHLPTTGRATIPDTHTTMGQSLQETTLANTPMMVSVMRAHIAHTEQTPVIVAEEAGTLASTPMMASVMSPFAAQEQTPVIVPAAAAVVVEEQENYRQRCSL